MKERIGKREIVGPGFNGEPCYEDRVDFPFPAIRFREDNEEICEIRERERCDWTMICIEDKKKLYRHSFCQTFAELKAPTGEWKKHIGLTMIIVSMGIWAMVLMKMFVYGPLPDTFDEEHQKAQLKRMLDLRVNPITGISSLWDYEKEDWWVNTKVIRAQEEKERKEQEAAEAAAAAEAEAAAAAESEGAEENKEGGAEGPKQNGSKGAK